MALTISKIRKMPFSDATKEKMILALQSKDVKSSLLNRLTAIKNRQKNANIDICLFTDEKIAEIKSLLGEATRENVKYKNLNDVIAQIVKYQTTLLNNYANRSCENKIELKKINETADILSDRFTQSDKDVLEKSKSQNTLLLGIGAVVILSGLFFIIKKRRK